MCSAQVGATSLGCDSSATKLLGQDSPCTITPSRVPRTAPEPTTAPRRQVARLTPRARRASGELRVVPSPVGLHVSATAAAAKPGDMEAVAQRALAAGVAVHPLSVFRVDGPARAGLVFGYGAIETEDIDDGLRRLVQAFHGR